MKKQQSNVESSRTSVEQSKQPQKQAVGLRVRSGLRAGEDTWSANA